MMEHLRTFHQTARVIHEAHHAHLHQSLLYFLISFIVLLLVAIFYLRTATSCLYHIPTSPTPTQQMFIFIVAIAIMGGVGFFAAVDWRWGSRAWLLYAICNLLMAAFIFAYQSAKRLSLIFSSIIMVGLGITFYWFFRRLAIDGSGETVLNFVGVVEAWALIWALYVLGQLMVYECNMDRQIQTICFFIVAITVFIVIAFWHVHQHASWSDMTGYLISGCALLTLMFFRNFSQQCC